jgi:guanylate kinase
MDDQLPHRRGIIFILSAPSGAGKTTISRAAREAIAGLGMSISLTTRRPREGEVEGVDYQFVSEEEFNRRIAAQELAEWAQNFEANYGTPRAPLDDAVETGRDILLDIDVQGARQIRELYPDDTATIFVLPPSFADLEQRLRGRATDSEDSIQRRLKRAREEAANYPEYDYLIINAHVEESLARLEAIVRTERMKVARLRADFVPWKN